MRINCKKLRPARQNMVVRVIELGTKCLSENLFTILFSTNHRTTKLPQHLKKTKSPKKLRNMQFEENTEEKLF